MSFWSGPPQTPPHLKPTFLATVQRPSSEATSLDEPPVSVVRSLNGEGRAFHVVCWGRCLQVKCATRCPPSCISASARSSRATWQRIVGRLCWRPTYVALPQGASSTDFKSGRKGQAFPPPSHYAYRRQLSPQLCAVFSRWGIAYWARLYGALCRADWDESNPFCTVLRCGLDRPWPKYPGLRVEEWAEKFFRSLSVYVVSPFGLAGPYPVGHGGGAGGQHGGGAVWCGGGDAAEVHRRCAPLGPLPVVFVPLRVDPLALYPTLPWSPWEICPEVVFSDDCTLLGRSFEGLSQVLEANCQSCWAIGGSVNSVKLNAYRVEFHTAGLCFVEGRWDFFLGPVPLEAGGLVMAGVQLVMGESPSEKLCKLEAHLRALRSRVVKLHLSYLLCLRIVHVYALSITDFVFEAMPP